MLTDERKAQLLDLYSRTYDGAPEEYGGPGYTIDSWCEDHELTDEETTWLICKVW